ncbi:MAG: AAA family ATPase [Spirochaetota bacterium]
MHLKSLELNGFKSFASKTVLNFPAGITAIVGPNGSGKSNIIDAVRWLFGERESKNLRSAKAEDLIFNGTPKKAKMSMAQAGIYFDNGSGFFPVDFKEVAITKRVARDGISQYFINKSEVKHKDIIDFFSRSRLGTKGLTIVGQGDSDLFVKASAQERRVMIEEILGLREYQLKKAEAERKLKNTGFNLEKVSAVMAEVVPRLRTLKRQTNKWLKRTEIENELKGVENFYFSQKLKEITDKEDEILPALKKIEHQIAEKQKEMSVAEGELRKVEARPQEYSEMKEIKNQRQNLSAKRSEIEKEFGRLEVKMEFLGKEKKTEGKNFNSQELIVLISEIKENLEKISENFDIEELKKGLKVMVRKISDFLNPARNASHSDAGGPAFGDLNKLKENLLKDFDKLEKEFKSLENREVEIAQGMEDFNKNFQKAFEILESKRKELADFEERKNKILFEKERLNLKFQDLESQLRQIGKSINEFKSGESERLKIEIGEPQEMERKIFKLRSELALMGEVDELLIKEAKETEEHYAFLNGQSADLEKAVVDLKNLIKELSEKIHSEFNGSLRLINEEFNKFFRLMFGGGQARLKTKNLKLKTQNDEIENEDIEGEKSKDEDKDKEEFVGVEIELSLPKKKINSLELLSGGERSLVSIAALFALISISPPPFLLLDEVEAALDENNSRRFASLVQEFSKKTQFIIVTHNRAVMEVADVLYGITVCDEGMSKVISLKMEAVA